MDSIKQKILEGNMTGVDQDIHDMLHEELNLKNSSLGSGLFSSDGLLRTDSFCLETTDHLQNQIYIISAVFSIAFVVLLGAFLYLAFVIRRMTMDEALRSQSYQMAPSPPSTLPPNHTFRPDEIMGGYTNGSFATPATTEAPSEGGGQE